MTFNIVVLSGDGVGPEVTAEAIKVLGAVSARYGHAFHFEDVLIGGIAIDTHGTALREEDIDRARSSDAVLLGAVGGPKWDNPAAKVRPEQGLLRLRKALGLFANLRPVRVMPALRDVSPLKPELVDGVDLLVVRELTGGIYFGRPSKQWRERRGRVAVDTLIYREHEVRRIIELAFEMAAERAGRVASVDKANVLESSRLWRSIATEVATAHADVTMENVLVDAMAMHLVRQPSRYDVVVTENMFGDILTDEASMMAGSIGLLPSASLGASRNGHGGRFGVYEPIHGSAPDIAGQGRANPVGTILSAAMMLRTSLGLEDEAATVEAAVESVLGAGTTTADVMGGTASTAEVGDAVAAAIRAA
ncbi:MAG TPA: 3-isopropylmalate dehydrogenase [Thermomicrobiales bacterium]|jgi:3-isopropylmalate dehydrogenase|nr:3-isopropylmalate dehydrogenase [Thermomicrobiales bacterium]